jgi:phosphoribosylaminoimidazole-succinocarboxamide synthase
MNALLETQLPFPKRQGKVRDIYDVGEHLLIIATDRISAFDCVMPNGIPDKGRLLTALSNFWFDKFSTVVPNHLVATDVRDFPASLACYRHELEGRSVLVRKAAVIPIECVARGYLAGSGWSEYRENQTVCGIDLPRGLRKCERLPQTIFTPATKESQGHDMNIPFDVAAEKIGVDRAIFLRDITIKLYELARAYAQTRGIIIADTKFEFGLVQDKGIILIDEILTPDSSRFWPADRYEPGRDPESFDKQFVRNYLETLNWNKQPPAPELPADVVQGTRKRYIEAYERMTGRRWT